jgi:ABC-type transport system substrate-binding protein
LFVAVLAPAETRPRYGGTLRVELRAEWTSAANPLRSLVFENLTTVDGAGNPQPQLATSWESQNGDRRWQFWLRRNVKFHDGTPLTATAAANLLMSTECETCPWRSVRAVGDSVVFEFDEPRPGFAAEVALPRYHLERATQGAAAGTGPFRVGERAGRNAGLVLEAFADCWSGRPFLDTIEVLDSRSEREQVMDFDVGRADMIEAAAEQVRRMRLPAAAAGGDRRAQTQSSQPVELVAIVVRPGRPALQDARVRQAIALSIDRAALHNVVLQKQGEVAGGLLPNWISGYAFLLPHTRDLARAQQVLRDAGKPPVLNIAADSADPVLRLVAERVAVNAADAGITITAVSRKDTADLVVTRLMLQSTNASVGLNELASHLTSAAAGAAPDSPQKTYEAERSLLADYMVIPLAYLPRTYAVGPRVKNWHQDALGRPRLESVWVSGTTP